MKKQQRLLMIGVVLAALIAACGGGEGAECVVDGTTDAGTT